MYNSSYGQNKWLLSCSPENCLDENLFNYYREIYTYSVKENLSCYHLNAMLLRTLMRMHFITPYHIMHVSIYAFMISYFMLMHIGLSEGITLSEFNEEEEEQQEAP